MLEIKSKPAILDETAPYSYSSIKNSKPGKINETLVCGMAMHEAKIRAMFPEYYNIKPIIKNCNDLEKLYKEIEQDRSLEQFPSQGSLLNSNKRMVKPNFDVEVLDFCSPRQKCQFNCFLEKDIKYKMPKELTHLSKDYDLDSSEGKITEDRNWCVKDFVKS